MRAAGIGIFCLLCPGLLPAQMGRQVEIHMSALGPLTHAPLLHAIARDPIHPDAAHPDAVEPAPADHPAPAPVHPGPEVDLPAVADHVDLEAAAAFEASRAMLEWMPRNDDDFPLRLHLWLMEETPYTPHSSPLFSEEPVGDLWQVLGTRFDRDDSSYETFLSPSIETPPIDPMHQGTTDHAEDSFLDLAYGWVTYDETRPSLMVGDLYSQHIHAGANVGFSSSTTLSFKMDYFFSDDERAFSVGVYAQTRF